MDRQQLLAQACSCLRRDQWQQVFPLMQQALVADPSDALPYVLLAKANLLAGHAQEGIDALEAALLLDDSLSDVRVLYGHLLWMADDPHAANQQFERALADQDDAGVHYWYARFLMTELVGLLGIESIARHARRAYEIEPSSPDHTLMMAIVGEMKGDHTGTEQYYLRALWQAPDDPIVLDNYGTFLYRQGEYERSLEALRRANQQCPQDPEIRKHLRRSINRVKPLWALARPLTKGLSWSGYALAVIAALLPRSGDSRWSSPWIGLLLLMLFMVEPLVGWLWSGTWLQVEPTVKTTSLE